MGVQIFLVADVTQLIYTDKIARRYRLPVGKPVGNRINFGTPSFTTDSA